MGDWTFIPTLSKSGTRVESILALRTSGNIVGDNIVGVWMRRGSSTWRLLAWSEQNTGQIVSYVKDNLGISDRYDRRWPVAPDDATASAPVGFSNGVLADDPMRTTIEDAPNPRGFLQDLVDSGWAAALIEFEIADADKGCSQHQLLEVYAESVEIERATVAADDGEGVDHLVQGLSAVACIDICWDHEFTISGPTLTGCTIVGGWGPPGDPIWTGGGQCAMTCWYEATQTCTWTRTQKQVNWDCSTCTFTQTGTCSETIQSQSTQYFPDCTEPVMYVCPPLPDDTGPNPPLCNPGNWTPPNPCD